jgi:glycosyltransferase involved in cell wall biosynthesis
MSLPPRLVILAAYHGQFEGSFIPMIRAVAIEARRRGWVVGMGFQESAERTRWFRDLSVERLGPVEVIPGAGRRETAAWIAERLKEPGPVILHTHFTTYDLPGAWVARRRPGTAIVWHVHTPAYRGPQATVRNAIKYGLVGRSVDAILAAGPDPAKGVLRVGAPRDRVAVVGSAINTEAFPLASAEHRRATRVRLGIPQDRRVLLHFAWDWYLKDGDLFLATVAALKERLGDGVLGLTVRGGTAAQEAIRRRGLEEAVRVMEPLPDVQELMVAADAFVSCSRVEGQPFAVIEALCCGLPIVATDLPGHHDICDGLASCRVVSRDPHALAAAAEELLSRSEEEASAQALAAREAMVARFDLGPWVERLFERYERVLAAQAAGSG